MLHSVLITHHSQNMMADQNNRQTSNIKRNNTNHSIHHFLSTILRQKLAQVEENCRSALGLTLKVDFLPPGYNKRQIELNMCSKTQKNNQNQIFVMQATN